jgi:hypothetical protein
MPEDELEIVYTMTHYWDGPRAGVASYQGKPHFYESQWDDTDEQDGSFLLTPIDNATLLLALEDWEMWRRWFMAWEEGRASTQDHPCLPQDADRHQEVDAMLKGKLVTDAWRAVRVHAEFVWPQNSVARLGLGPEKVRWRVIASS